MSAADQDANTKATNTSPIPSNLQSLREEPTIDWLIDTICPNKGNSPLVNFNKERLRKLIKEEKAQHAISERLDELEHITGFSEVGGVYTIAGATETRPIRERKAELKAQQEEKHE